MKLLEDKQKDSHPTLIVYSAIWLESAVKGVLDDDSHERYGEVLSRDILPSLGNRSLDSITVGDIDDLMNNLIREGRTHKAIGLVRSVLSSCLHDAARKNLIETNPLQGYRHNRRKNKTVEARGRKQHEVNPFTEEEADRLVVFSLESFPNIYGPIFLCALRAGLRIGELVALHWDDVLWDKGMIHVQRMYKRGKIKSVKNGKSRFVDMSDQLRDILKALLAIQEREAVLKNEIVPNIIFHCEGKYRAQNTVRSAFKNTLKKAGLREIRFHDLRHTYACHLIGAGVSLAYIKSQLGHESIRTTVDIYGHLIPGTNREAVNKLDRPIGINLERHQVSPPAAP